MAFVESTHPLDFMLGMWYKILNYGPVAEIVEPKRRSFIVIEEYDIPISRRPQKYCVYILAKRGKTSIEASRSLAKRLGVPWVSTLGLKDTDATTLQVLCLPCPKNPPIIISGPGPQWARFLGYTSRCPRKGSNMGNCFIIVLKVLSRNLSRALETIKISYLPAYYAYQRFGTRRPNTHLVGIRLLKVDHVSFIEELLISDYPTEGEKTRYCRRTFWNDPKLCRNLRFYENIVARRLKISMDFLRSINKMITEMFLSAVQAYIFNLYVSLRIKRGYDYRVKLSGERITDSGVPLVYIPGIGYKVGISGKAYEILMDALEYAGLSYDDLADPPPGIPRLRPYWRPAFTRVRGLSYMMHGDNIVLRFCMEKGMYATLVLREIVDVDKL